MKKSTLITGAALIIFAVFMYSQTAELPKVAARLPRALLICLMILTVLMGAVEWLEGRKNKTKKVSEPPAEKTYYGIASLGILLIGLNVFLLKPVGYFVITPVYLIITLLMLKVNIVKSLLVSILFTAFIYVIFVKVLMIPIPMGILA